MSMYVIVWTTAVRATRAESESGGVMQLSIARRRPFRLTLPPRPFVHRSARFNEPMRRGLLPHRQNKNPGEHESRRDAGMSPISDARHYQALTRRAEEWVRHRAELRDACYSPHLPDWSLRSLGSRRVSRSSQLS